MTATAVPGACRPASGRWLHCGVEARDQHRVVTAFAAAALAAAAAMDAVGLPPVDLHGLLHHLGVRPALRRYPRRRLHRTSTPRRVSAAAITATVPLAAPTVRQQLRADLLIAGT